MVIKLRKTGHQKRTAATDGSWDVAAVRCEIEADRLVDGDLAELKESRDAGACAVEHAVGVFLRLEQPRWQGLRAVPTQVHRTPSSCSRHLKLPMSSLADDCFPAPAGANRLETTGFSLGSYIAGIIAGIILRVSGSLRQIVRFRW